MSPRVAAPLLAEPTSRLALRLSIAGRRLGAMARGAQEIRLPSFRTLTIGLLGSTAVYGTVLGGHVPAVLDWAGAPLGYTIERVEVSGNSETSQIDILQTVWMGGAATLPALDVEGTRIALEAMPWIETATVSKTYPDALNVTIVEKAPYAVWQQGNQLLVIDRDGKPIVPFATTRFTDLPLVVGLGADAGASELLDRIEVIPELTPRIRAYVRVAERRWDLHLTNGVVVKLPEKDPLEAAAELVLMDRENRILSRDIVSVDMRVPDRLVVKLTPEAKIRRDEALEQRERMVGENGRRNTPA